MSDRTTNPVVCLQSLVGDARVDPSVVEYRPRRVVQWSNGIVDARHRMGGPMKTESRLMHQCHFLYISFIFPLWKAHCFTNAVVLNVGGFPPPSVVQVVVEAHPLVDSMRRQGGRS